MGVYLHLTASRLLDRQVVLQDCGDELEGSHEDLVVDCCMLVVCGERRGKVMHTLGICHRVLVLFPLLIVEMRGGTEGQRDLLHGSQRRL
jgi:hypothetical protein